MVYSGGMFNQEGNTKMEETLESAKAAARVLNVSTSDWTDAEGKALRPMARPLAEYGDLRALTVEKLEAARTLLEALDELEAE